MKRFFPLVMTGLLSVMLSGCEVKSNYKVLSLFFDGVPNLETGQVQSAGLEAGLAAKKQSVRYKPHAPYAAKACDGCHIPQTNALIASGDQLCYRCHDMKLNKKVVHAAIAASGCGGCHQPHNSRYPKLLVGSLEEVCFTCHEQKSVREKGAHKGLDMPCTDCHDPHQSDNPYLIK
ncbi:MAG: hypothetical protein HZA15_07665 [Nitrospirae bacterium]|nr:hypothetical protein [Nitrospirota bacterium]